MNPLIAGLLMLCLLLPPVLQAGEVEGVLMPADRQLISVPIEGVVTRVAVSAGQRVNKGAVLLQLSQASYRIQLRQAQAAVKALEPALQDALREKNDAEALFEQTVLSEVELQAAQIHYRQLEAQMQQAKASLDLVRWQLGWTTVTAPRDALVTAVHVLPGQVIAGDVRSQPLLELASPDALQVVAEVAADTASRLQPGQVLQLQADGQSLQASVSSITLPAAPASQARIVARVNHAASLAAGMRAVLQLP